MLQHPEGVDKSAASGGDVTPTQYLRKVISNYELGVITDRELPGAVFRGLTTENLRELLTFASPRVLATLRNSAAAAPTDDKGWSELISITGGTFDARDEETWRQAEAIERTRFRQGVETLRRHFEGR